MCSREPEETKEGGEDDAFNEPDGYALPPPVGATETWAEPAPEAAGAGGFAPEAAAGGFEAAGEHDAK